MKKQGMAGFWEYRDFLPRIILMMMVLRLRPTSTEKYLAKYEMEDKRRRVQILRVEEMWGKKRVRC